jgi:hypothetical protein
MEYQIAPRRDPRERKMTKYSTFHQSFVLGYLMLGELIAEYGGETEIRDAQFSSRSGSTGGINCFGDPNCKKHSSNGIYHRSKKKWFFCGCYQPSGNQGSKPSSITLPSAISPSKYPAFVPFFRTQPRSAGSYPRTTNWVVTIGGLAPA